MGHGLISSVGSTVYRQFNCTKLVEIRPLFLAVYGTAVFQDTTLEMHKWLLYPVLTADAERLEKGFKQAEIRNILQEVHPRKEELNSGNVTQSLQSLASLQIKKDIKPMVLDYDQTNLRLSIVDKSFQIWLSRQYRNEILDLIGLPRMS